MGTPRHVSVRKWKERLRKEALKGERPWNSLDGSRSSGSGSSDPGKRERERERAYGPPERREWMRRQPSVVSGETPCVSAHINPEGEGPSGMGRKHDYKWTVPLTWEEHQELHQFGQSSFEDFHGIDLTEAARETERRWQEVASGFRNAEKGSQ